MAGYSKDFRKACEGEVALKYLVFWNHASAETFVAGLVIVKNWCDMGLGFVRNT